MPKRSVEKKQRPIHISLIGLPDAAISTLSGIFDALNSFKMLAGFDDVIPDVPPFKIEIVGEKTGALQLASGIPINVQNNIKNVRKTNIVIVPSVLVGKDGWQKDRYHELVKWVTKMHQKGALLCSACSGIFLLAETGIFDGKDVTIHWSYINQFKIAFPSINLQPEQVLICTGKNEELITSGASNSWHDLVLYLIARYEGSAVAQSIAKFFALQWHRDGLAPYIKFETPLNHNDAEIAELQNWLAKNFTITNPVEQMVIKSSLPERTLKRRFKDATDMSPITYVQRLRIEEAKKLLERTDKSVDDISWEVGYEDASYFRKLFKKITGISPSSYRRKFNVPEYEQIT